MATIEQAAVGTDGVAQAARALGLSRQGLLKKLRRYGLTAVESGAIALDGPRGAA